MQTKNQYHPHIQRLLSEGYLVRPVDYLSEGFEMVKRFLPAFMIFSSLYVGLTLVSIQTKYVGTIIQALISGPFFAGLFLAYKQIDLHKGLNINTFIGGFYMFIPVLLANLATGLFTSLGLLLFIVPGIYFFISYIFVMPMVVFEGMDFWSAMENSRLVVQRQFLQVTSLAMLFIVINILGALFFTVGLVITIPITYAAIYRAYIDIFQNFGEDDDSTMEDDNDGDEDNTLKLSHFR